MSCNWQRFGKAVGNALRGMYIFKVDSLLVDHLIMDMVELHINMLGTCHGGQDRDVVQETLGPLTSHRGLWTMECSQ
jgi:hypothetical protein